LQAPSLPQLAAPWSVQWFSGSVPAGTSMHCPSLPAIAHERQVPPQAVAQQTPSMQKPEAQSAAAVHAAPGGLGPQLPFTHAAPPTQSALLAQSARQASPPGLHMYAPHESATAAAALADREHERQRASRRRNARAKKPRHAATRFRDLCLRTTSAGAEASARDL
jgi:hypothetical protein